jgi:hypothetical protein
LVSILLGEDFNIPKAAEKKAKPIALSTAVTKLITRSLFLLCKKQGIRPARKGRGIEKSRQ